MAQRSASQPQHCGVGWLAYKGFLSQVSGGKKVTLVVGRWGPRLSGKEGRLNASVHPPLLSDADTVTGCTRLLPLRAPCHDQCPCKSKEALPLKKKKSRQEEYLKIPL